MQGSKTDQTIITDKSPIDMVYNCTVEVTEDQIAIPTQKLIQNSAATVQEVDAFMEASEQKPSVIHSAMVNLEENVSPGLQQFSSDAEPTESVRMNSYHIC